jgi:hypothetical protein
MNCGNCWVRRCFPAAAVVLAFLLGCQKSATAPPESVGKRITLIHNTADIPSACKLAFAKLSGESQFKMANPGEKYQLTDVIYEEGLPWRRLMFSAVKNKRCAIVYEHGGIGVSTHSVVLDISTNPATVAWIGSALEMNDIGGLGERLDTPQKSIHISSIP